MWDKNDWIKLGFIIFSFIEALVMGLLPVKCKSFKESPAALGVANAFAGGVFIAISLMHIMPEQVETYAEMDKDFPLPWMILVLGYTLILVIDKVLFDAHAILDGHDHKVIADAQDKLKESIRKMSMGGNDAQNQEALKETQGLLEEALRKSIATRKSDQIAARLSMTHNKEPIENQKEYLIDDGKIQTNSTAGGSPHEAQKLKLPDHSKKPSCIENMSPFVILIGLGVHSIFEGISVGLSTKLDSTLMMALAIILHKGAAGMSLGISMVKTFPDEECFVTWMMLLFACFTPIGVTIGWLLSDSSDMTELVFSCLAAGTFLYIACSEVIIEEFSEPRYKFLKLLVYAIGIGIITSLKFIEEAGEDDGGDS